MVHLFYAGKEVQITIILYTNSVHCYSVNHCYSVHLFCYTYSTCLLHKTDINKLYIYNPCSIRQTLTVNHDLAMFDGKSKNFPLTFNPF